MTVNYLDINHSDIIRIRGKIASVNPESAGLASLSQLGEIFFAFGWKRGWVPCNGIEPIRPGNERSCAVDHPVGAKTPRIASAVACYPGNKNLGVFVRRLQGTSFRSRHRTVEIIAVRSEVATTEPSVFGELPWAGKRNQGSRRTPGTQFRPRIAENLGWRGRPRQTPSRRPPAIRVFLSTK